MASQQLVIPRIAAVGTSFSPLPCQAWHGYGVTSAHRVEVEVGADGHASAPPSDPPPLRRRRAHGCGIRLVGMVRNVASGKGFDTLDAEYMGVTVS
jgi:hypothetical protein